MSGGACARLGVIFLHPIRPTTACICISNDTLTVSYHLHCQATGLKISICSISSELSFHVIPTPVQKLLLLFEQSTIRVVRGFREITKRTQSPFARYGTFGPRINRILISGEPWRISCRLFTRWESGSVQDSPNLEKAVRPSRDMSRTYPGYQMITYTCQLS